MKKMLYTIRCILAWNVLDNDEFPSMNLNNLLNESDIDDSIKKNIAELKESYSELNVDSKTVDNIKSLIPWIEDSIDVKKNDKEKSGNNRNIEEYNKRFKEIILV